MGRVLSENEEEALKSMDEKRQAIADMQKEGIIDSKVKFFANDLIYLLNNYNYGIVECGGCDHTEWRLTNGFDVNNGDFGEFITMLTGLKWDMIVK